MSDVDQGRATALRAEFDAAFERPVAAAGVAPEAILRISVGETPFAVRIREVAFLGRSPALTRAPSRAAPFSGLTAIRGQLLPVYALDRLLDLPSGGDASWLLLPRAAHAVGLSFHHFGGQLLVAPEELASGSVRLGPTLVPLLELAAVLRRVETLAQPNPSGG